MFSPAALMCVEWLSAVKKRTVIAPHLKGPGKMMIPQGPPPHSTPIQEEIITQGETQSPPCSPYGASVVQLGLIML